MRLVIDTNLWVSYLLNPSSETAAHIDALLPFHTLIYSHETLTELADVLLRPKFNRYIDAEDIKAFITAYVESAEQVMPKSTIKACRDSKDDKFLELAIDGQADVILSGDTDLLDLKSYNDIPIIKLKDFITGH